MTWPGVAGNRLKTPATINGNVIPNRMACGRIKAPAMLHFTTVSIALPVMAGKMVSYAKLVTLRKSP